MIYERAQAEASKSERQHGGQKHPFHYVRGYRQTEMNEWSARQRERARHRLRGPTGRRGRSKVKRASSAAKGPVVHSVEGIEFREQSAPPQNHTERVKQIRRLKQDSCQDPHENGPRSEVNRPVLPPTNPSTPCPKPLQHRQGTFNSL